MNLVQPIVVSKSGCHEDVIMAVASASVRAYAENMYYHQHEDAWLEWLKGAFTKTVRRGTNNQFQEWTQHEVAQAGAVSGEATATAGYPVDANDLPVILKKMHVAGLDRQRTGVWDTNWHMMGYPALPKVMFALNPYIEMTTGKAAAQAAHALFQCYLFLSKDILGCPYQFTDNKYVFDQLNASKNITVRINDAGFTEVKPGPLTVIGGIL